ncbi:MAG: hypothetical protein Aurels2KO_12670 [Aureliella sp.]
MMWNHFTASAGLLAEGRVDVMAQGFEVYEAEGGQSALIIVAMCLAALAVAVVVYLYARRRLRATTVEPWSLFRELCSANKLTPRQRLLMRAIAKAKGLKDPCGLFVDSSLWLVQPASEPHLCRPGKVKQIRRLQKILFQPVENEAA